MEKVSEYENDLEMKCQDISRELESHEATVVGNKLRLQQIEAVSNYWERKKFALEESQLKKENAEKESRIRELKNQQKIIDLAMEHVKKMSVNQDIIDKFDEEFKEKEEIEKLEPSVVLEKLKNGLINYYHILEDSKFTIEIIKENKKLLNDPEYAEEFVDLKKKKILICKNWWIVL